MPLPPCATAEVRALLGLCVVMTDRLIFGITLDSKAGNPDQAAERPAMAMSWDEHLAQEAASAPTCWASPGRRLAPTATPTGT